MKSFYSLNKEDLDWCVKRLPKKVIKVMKNFPKEATIGGGYIRSCITGDHLKDIDLFVSSVEVAEKINEQLLNPDQKTFKTKNAYTILRGEKPPIQIIFRWLYKNPKDVLLDLDFTICCAAIWFEYGSFKSAIHEMYYSDLAAKRLRYTSPSRIEEAGGSLLRVLKYYNKGYRIMLTSFAKTIARMVISLEELSFSSWDESKKHADPSWTKEDQLAKVFNGLLVEVDPNSVAEVDIIRDVEPEEDEEDETFNI
jgi:hypothetical protein